MQSNNTDRFQDSFPYLSPCGIERNFVRCDDTPVVYRELRPAGTSLKQPVDLRELVQATSPAAVELVCAGTTRVEFEPEHLQMTESGRLYYPMPEQWRHLGDLALVASPIALALAGQMRFGTETILHWQGDQVKICVSLEEG